MWDKILPQVFLTLNLLRQSNVAPTVSAYAYINGPFDYNAMPLAPMGCAAQIYESTNRRKTWVENSIDGWYLRTSTEHYRSHLVHVKKTRSERITDTVWFKHKYITQPKVTPVNHIVKAINDLTCALKGRKNTEGLEVLDITYLTIHVDAGALAFTRCKNLPPRHLPPRHFGETNQNTQHNIVR